MGGFGSMGCEVVVAWRWNLPGRTISVQPVIVITIAIVLSVVAFAVSFFGTQRRAMAAPLLKGV